MRVTTLNRSILIFLLILCSCCHRYSAEKRLDEIDNVIAQNPDSALQLLKQIQIEKLNTANKNLYRLLEIKAQDKADIPLVSDSIISEVIDYYSQHNSDPRYPEALYYGGRVAKETSDFPSAIKYFQDALEIVPEGKDNNLRGNILSQTAQLMNNMRMYNQAIPYVHEVLKIEIADKDTVNLIHDLFLLGALYLHSEKLDSASLAFNKLEKLSAAMSEEKKARLRMYQAGIELERNNLTKAQELIEGTPDKIKSNDKFTAFAYAANIYYTAGRYDSAYKYAKMLADNPSIRNNKNGYFILMSKEMQHYIPQDSLAYYSNKYMNAVMDFVNKHDNEAVMIQNSIFNYQTHERARKKAEITNKKYGHAIIITSFFLTALLFAFYIYKLWKQREILRLQQKIESLKNININNVKKQSPHDYKYESTSNMKDLKDTVKEEILSILDSDSEPKVADVIITSKEYEEINEILKRNLIISDNSNLWSRIED